jgi:hypothetical protein
MAEPSSDAMNNFFIRSSFGWVPCAIVVMSEALLG